MKNIITNFKSGKNDVDYHWKSDALKAGVELLASPLSNMLKVILNFYISFSFSLASELECAKIADLSTK